jgi:hypothetical protein
MEVFQDLARRARQRGFVMMAEVQQELEDAAAPPDAFDQVVEALREVDIEVREDSPEAVYGGVSGMDEIEVSDPMRSRRSSSPCRWRRAAEPPTSSVPPSRPTPKRPPS